MGVPTHMVNACACIHIVDTYTHACTHTHTHTHTHRDDKDVNAVHNVGGQQVPDADGDQLHKQPRGNGTPPVYVSVLVSLYLYLNPNLYMCV